jgi:hypothetical protein
MITRDDIVPGLFFKSSTNYYVGKIVRVYEREDGMFDIGFSGPDNHWGNKETGGSSGWRVIDGKIIGHHVNEGTTGYSTNRNNPDDRHYEQLWIVEPNPYMLAGPKGQTELSL